MKKTAILLALSLIAATPVYADCTGGTSFAGGNGVTYCISTASMNWWSAFTWCKKNGMHLATYEEAFPGVTLRYYLDCSAYLSANLSRMGAGLPWLALPDGTANAFGICAKSSGSWHSVVPYTRTTKKPALCAPNAAN